MTELRDQLQACLGAGYSIERELGGGGMSRVFVATENALGRRVVVKVLPPELTGDVNVDRFHREIRLAAQLQHPHIVTVLSTGEMNGLPYYTMPFVRGESLRGRLSRGEIMPIVEVVGLLGDVAKALLEAHENGVVHRDIKPDNILISGGAAVVADFGIAKAISVSRTQPGGGASITQVGLAVGTPTYMAPEQASGDPDTDHRADIYAFGCLAYEMLTGRPPFVHLASHKQLAAHLSETPDPVVLHRDDTPPELAALVMHCLAKDPDKRPQSAAELLVVLDAMQSGAEFPAVVSGSKKGFVRKILFAWLLVVIVALVATLLYHFGA
ncbi:MAG: protein kinase [Gemmatimonadetes bacterium]|nr:protein kinase [Gemmatimonadota bacterium]